MICHDMMTTAELPDDPRPDPEPDPDPDPGPDSDPDPDPDPDPGTHLDPHINHGYDHMTMALNYKPLTLDR